jgi:hypothetical protein
MFEDTLRGTQGLIRRLSRRRVEYLAAGPSGPSQPIGCPAPGCSNSKSSANQGLRPRWAGRALAIARPSVLLPPTERRRGAQDDVDFAAQWLSYAIPCRRFAGFLPDTCARLGADVVCYTAADFHHPLLAGLPAYSVNEPNFPITNYTAL